MTSKEFVGQEREVAYAKILDGTVNGGFNDRGMDVVLTNSLSIQVKSSVAGLMDFLGKSLKFKRFIPVVVGEPGTKEEILGSLAQFGGWVGRDVPQRERVLVGIAQVRVLLEGSPHLRNRRA
ncbi:MAG: hypothetical protein Q7R72_01205 [bacterium]|nr:hypothetical protein [bacterium]